MPKQALDHPPCPVFQYIQYSTYWNLIVCTYTAPITNEPLLALSGLLRISNIGYKLTIVLAVKSATPSYYNRAKAHSWALSAHLASGRTLLCSSDWMDCLYVYLGKCE